MSDLPVSRVPVSHEPRPGFASVPKRLIRDALIRGAGQRALRNSRNPSVSRVDRTCANLRLDPAAVARRALDTGPLQRFVAAYSPERPLPSILDRAAAHRAEDFAGADIEALDAERYEEPAVVAKRVEGLLARASGPVPIAELLGVLGSCHRMVHRYQEAASAIALAIEIADVAERTDVVARQALRAFAIEVDRGEVDQARGLVRVAQALYARLNDDESGAEALICLAVLCDISGNSELAIQHCRTALEIGLRCPRLLVNVHQVHAAALIRVGRLSESQQAADLAASAKPRGRFLTGPLSWLSGQIAAALGDFEYASQHFAEAYEAIPERIGDRLLIGAEWIDAALESGDISAATDLAQSMCDLLNQLDRLPCKAGRAFRAAILQLALAAARAEWSSTVVADAMRWIEEGRSALEQDDLSCWR